MIPDSTYGAAVGLLHFPFYHPYARCLNTPISSEQAKIVFHTMLDLCSRERFKHWVEHIEKSPYPLIRLVNGSEIWIRSVGYEAELLRGFEFDLINIDEAAYIQSRMTIDTLKGRLLGFNMRTQEPRAGLMWQTTTPKGKRMVARIRSEQSYGSASTFGSHPREAEVMWK